MQHPHPLRIFKFGGASVKDAAAIRNLCRIVQEHSAGPLVIVVSAMGKTTNALEAVFQLAFEGQPYEQALQQVEEFHLSTAIALLGPEEVGEETDSQLLRIRNWLRELRTALAAIDSQAGYDQQYDQVVSYGELLASQLVYEVIHRQNELPPAVRHWRWHDARRSICTDETWREGKVDWAATQAQLNRYQEDEHAAFAHCITITQGFIGGAPSVPVPEAYLESTGRQGWQRRTTTLGREGSDYTAAIFAYCLNAESVTIWKDVAGLLNADPKIFANPVRYPEISYQETIEMAYYGASVIHPKTIKPLAVRRVPLLVKSFLDPGAEGTRIHDCRHGLLAPAFIRKTNQCLISFESKDLTFISEENLEVIFGVLAQVRLKIHLMQNSAISFSVCTDFSPYRLEKLLAALREQFTIHYNTGLELYTIKNYDAASLRRLTHERELLLEQRTRQTFQFVCRAVENEPGQLL
ncbi:aspartate kinase [Hymenobacter sp. HSC-4F20]|uniref:aspartate kinase n=1 Tax=Hymenobacter sp. HSC-4F20 TaxID=2864135 RepID=UPI001C73AD89|nr:aspartate kinase [Hymenobacter sp. HSC-4F20]MBX0289959.1 aspartate kinase [Hymenobacter sp. HSC-4F20]